MSEGRLSGRVAIVTGSSRGIGKAIALAFAREGAAVAVAARTEAVWDSRLPGTIHETASEIEVALDRIEVVKGPTSVLSGSDAVGGTVQFK